MYKILLLSTSNGQVTFEIIASAISVLTPIVALLWFLYSRRLQYYSSLVGTYNSYDQLLGDERSTALFTLKIEHVADSGWFFGSIDYCQPFMPRLEGSAGTRQLIGSVNHPFFDLTDLYSRSNPLSKGKQRKYKGLLYIISRNDFDTENRSWEDFAIEKFDMTHYRDSFRLRISNKIPFKQGGHKTQLKDSHLFVNTNVIPDEIFKVAR